MRSVNCICEERKRENNLFISTRRWEEGAPARCRGIPDGVNRRRLAFTIYCFTSRLMCTNHLL